MISPFRNRSQENIGQVPVSPSNFAICLHGNLAAM